MFLKRQKETPVMEKAQTCQPSSFSREIPVFFTNLYQVRNGFLAGMSHLPPPLSSQPLPGTVQPKNIVSTWKKIYLRSYILNKMSLTPLNYLKKIYFYFYLCQSSC